MADYTWASVYWMYSLMALFGVGAVYFLVRAVKSGAVASDEAPKFRMLEDDDVPASERGGDHDGKEPGR